MVIIMIKKRLKKKWKVFLIIMLLIVSIVCLTISSYNIIKYRVDKKDIDNQLNIIENKVNIEQVDNSSNIEIINNEDIDEKDPYWDYINMNLIDVNFEELKSINNHTKGWIQVNGTNINYPFVQAYTNEHYLYHSFDGSWNSAGWVFLDYRNRLSNFNDKNTIIYAHGRLDKTMFGSLKNILTSGWLDNTDNYIVKLSTEYENTLWQVFSIYRIPETSDYLQISFEDDNEFETFANMLLKRSDYNFNTTISPNDRILTLSTCYNNNDRLVMHAKLIKREAK